MCTTGSTLGSGQVVAWFSGAAGCGGGVPLRTLAAYVCFAEPSLEVAVTLLRLITSITPVLAYALVDQGTVGGVDGERGRW
ncbi:MAG: hypothetical protein LC808_15245 [Actinobacteria bacterium]|nr:hypothetical protein [Actinomycetota bacterium]